MKPYSLYANITDTTAMSKHSTYMRSVADTFKLTVEIDPLTGPLLKPDLKRQHTVRGTGDPTPETLKSLLNFDEYIAAKTRKHYH